MYNQTVLTSNLHKIWDGVSLYRNVFFNNNKIYQNVFFGNGFFDDININYWADPTNGFSTIVLKLFVILGTIKY